MQQSLLQRPDMTALQHTESSLARKNKKGVMLKKKCTRKRCYFTWITVKPQQPKGLYLHENV